MHTQHTFRAVLAFALMTFGCASEEQKAGSSAASSMTLALPGCLKSPTEGQLMVHFNAGYTAEDVAEWLAGWSCRDVVVPRHVAGLQSGTSFDETVALADHAGLLDRLLEKLDLVSISDEKSTVIVERSVRAEGAEGRVRLSPIKAPREPRTATPPPSSRRPRSPLDEAMKKTIEEGISKTSEYRYTITQEVLDSVVENPTRLGRGARIVPAIKNGKPNGFKLYAVRPSSIYSRLGLMNGDTVVTINGRKLTTPHSALETYTSLVDAKKFKLELIRRGKPVTLHYRITK